jgi:hypothetical protein
MNDTRGRTDDVIFVAALCLAGFGFVLGFNQVATQSAIDAVAPVALFSAGFAGLVNGFRRILVDPVSSTLRVVGLTQMLIAIYAVATVAFHLHVSQQAIATASVAAIGALAVLRTRRLHSDGEPEARDQIRTFADLAQAFLLIYFSLLACSEGNIGPFG